MRLDQVTDDDLASEVLATFVDRDDVHRVVIAPGASRPGRRPRPRPGGQGARAAGQPAAADVRGRRLVGRVRRRRRHHAARRPPLRPDALVVARASAPSTSSAPTLGARPARAAAASCIAARDPARQPAGPCSSARRASAATAAASRCSSSARWSPARTRRKAELLHRNEADGPVQDRRRPADHPRRAAPAPHVARRASAAVQRPARRDEPRRPAAARARGRPPGRGLVPPPPAPHAGHDRPLAGPRLGPRSRCARWSTIDYLYVANWSLWSDVKILLRTLAFVIGRRGM